MKSASAYTNTRRVTAIGKNTKVEYPKYIAKNWGLLQPAVRCNPNFEILIYKDNCNCNGLAPVFPTSQPSGLGSILDGGQAPEFTPEFVLEGSGSTEPSPTYVLDGGSS